MEGYFLYFISGSNCCSRFPILRDVSDGEMRMEAAACAIVMYFCISQAQPSVPWRSEFESARKIRLAWSSHLYFTFSSYFGQSGVAYGDCVLSSLGSTEMCWMTTKKTHFPSCIKRKLGSSEYFASRKFGKDADCYFKLIKCDVC